MKLAFAIGTAQRDWEELRSFALEAERIGVDSVWSAELKGHDAFTPLAFIAGQTTRLGLGTGVVSVGSRSPAMLAMSAVSLASMSNGRFMLGLGGGTRETLENWHGRPFFPASRHLTETALAVRMAASGEPLIHNGRTISVPGGSGSVLAMEPGLATNFPVYFAALSPKSLEATGAVADGWVGGASFVPELAGAFWGPIRAGAVAAGRSLSEFDFMAPAFLVEGERLRAAAAVKPFLASLIARAGGWEGSHHSAVYERSGHGELVQRLRELFAAGKLDAAAALMPDELAANRCLSGTDAEIRGRIRAYRDCGVTTIQAYWFGGSLLAALEPLARVRVLMDEANSDT